MALDADLRPADPGAPGPVVAAPPPRGVERRDFLKLAGVGAAASLAACQRLPVTHAIPHLVPPEGITPGASLRYASTCSACPASCGLVAVVRDGRPVKLEGRAEHPLSRGGLCAVGQADLRALYDPSRLRGPKLDGKDVSWAALDESVRSRLASVRERGLGVALLTPSVVSPTARRVLQLFAEQFGATWVEMDPGPESSSAVLEAYAGLTGRPLLPYPEPGEADLLVVLGGDPLGTGPDPVGFTAAWAERRRRPEAVPFRHVQIEGSLSLSGAVADERWPATASERRQAALWLLRRIAEESEAPEAATVLEALSVLALPDGRLGRRVDALAGELLRRRSRAVLMTGDDDLAEATAVALSNRLLGSTGLDLARPSLVRRGQEAPLHGLLEAVRRSEIGALFALDVDPVDQLAEGGALADALRGMPLSVAVTDRPTATAAACVAVAAAHHGLEAWGDHEPRKGVSSLAQPALRPLFDTRHAMESFLAWQRGSGGDYREELRARWQGEMLASPSETAWRAAVASAGSAGVGAPPEPSEPIAMDAGFLARVLAAGSPLADAPDGLEAELIAEVARREGSRAHVPWLQELPDPLTRVSWTACLRIAPELAASAGLRDGDVARLEVGSGAVAMPVRVVPGQHPRVVGVPVGYGRYDGDASRPETNAYRLQLAVAGRRRRQGLPARLSGTGERVPLPLVQTQPSAEGRPIVHQVHARDEAPHGAHHPEGRSLWAERERRSPQWHMVIDLDACTGCSACVVACQAENNIPVVGADEMRRNRGLYWLRIDRYFEGEPQAPDVLFEPMLCAQCDRAPCETVCPVAATVHSQDGLNQQVYNRCVGTRYCANNCPYKVRAFNWFAPDVGEPLERMVLNPDVVVRARGVMEKCSFCVQRIQAARIDARALGAERLPEVQTACQESCPARAISFGDATDPESEVSRRRHEPRAFQVLAELGIEPSITYLARVRSLLDGEERA